MKAKGIGILKTVVLTGLVMIGIHLLIGSSNVVQARAIDMGKENAKGIVDDGSTTEVSVKIIWNDKELDEKTSEDLEGVKMFLYANGEELYNVTLSHENNWRWTYHELERCDEYGKVIDYQFKQDALEGYVTNLFIEDNNFVFTNNREDLIGQNQQSFLKGTGQILSIKMILLILVALGLCYIIAKGKKEHIVEK